MRKQKGFTLIELLVVIAIIGLLSTLAVVSLNNARAKARDAKRVSDLKQISTLIEMEAANTENNSYDDVITVCDPNTAPALMSTCTVGSSVTATANFTDPSESGTVCVDTTPADGTIDGLCDYTIVAEADESYEICGMLEDGAGGLTAGEISVTEGSHLQNGCTGL